MRFNEAIDELIINSISSYSARKEQATHLVDTMLEAAPDPVAIFDPAGRHLYLNMAKADFLGAPERDIIGKTPHDLDLNFAAFCHDAINAAVTSRQSQRRDWHHRLPSGRGLYFDCHFVPVFDDHNEVEAVVESLRDVTERKQTEYRVWLSANFDPLTGLPNRRLFLDRLEQNLLEARRKASSVALLFIDLDLFKRAKDRLGHKSGDRLLALVAERIGTKVRAMDTLARLGGDEFTLILKETGRGSAMEAARGVLASLERPFDVGSHQVHISASIGVTLFPDDGKDVEELMHTADQAMYTAKQQGGQQVQAYESWMSQSESEHMRLNRELIKEAGQGGDADCILDSVIAMAHAMDVQVVGVGVETDRQLQFLSRAGCDYGQGFLFSPPLHQDDFETLLRRDRPLMPS